MLWFKTCTVGAEHLTEVTCSCCKKAQVVIYTEGDAFSLVLVWEKLQEKGWEQVLGGAAKEPACPKCFGDTDKRQLEML